MSVARFARSQKRQLGQFFTPDSVARNMVSSLDLVDGARVLEPSFGRGVFLDALTERTAASHLKLDLFGCEIDDELFSEYAARRPDVIATLVRTDFFRWMPQSKGLNFLDAAVYRRQKWEYFDLILGNPPFGGSIDGDLQDRLDAIYGLRLGQKIKKETYSFFVVKSLDLLRPGGELVFICSDTFLTINTMRGLRGFLMSAGEVRVDTLADAFDETNHPMVVLRIKKGVSVSDAIYVDGRPIPYAQIRRTANLSWNIDHATTRYFSGVTIGDYLVCTSGMTIGNNELFVRDVKDGYVEEPYRFEFFQDPITVAGERERARLNALSDRQTQRLAAIEQQGGTRRNVRAIPRQQSLRVRLPDSHYLPYNKASSAIVYEPPRWALYWENDGDAVLTFKRNGNWYLHGVGGKPYFQRPGFTWALVSPRMHTRYLPPGYILDSGAPCAFPRGGVPFDEVYFVMGWTLTTTFTTVLKTTINHTRNIQGKDVERMPYPVWVDLARKQVIVAHVRSLIKRGEQGVKFTHDSAELRALDGLFAWDGEPARVRPLNPEVQPALFP